MSAEGQPEGRVTRLVRRADRRTMPWKNGGGVTHELWREDHDGALGLRISIAEVAADGPFSHFPGVDRVILLLEGEACVLHRDDGTEVVLRPRRPFAFLGEDAWACTLPEGPVLDFNVMTQRGTRGAAVRVCEPGRIEADFVLALAPGEIGGAAVDTGELAAIDGPVWADVPVVAVHVARYP